MTPQLSSELSLFSVPFCFQGSAGFQMSDPTLSAEPPSLCYFLFTTASHFLGTVILSLSSVSLLERMTTYLSFLAIVHSCRLASVNTAFQEVSKNLWITTYIQWYPRYLRLIQQLRCQLQISPQTFLFIVPGTVSSLILFHFPFLFSFHLFFFIYCVHACTHIPWHNKMSEGSFLSLDHVCDFWGLNSDCQAWWQVPLLREPPTLFWDLFSVIVLG